MQEDKVYAEPDPTPTGLKKGVQRFVGLGLTLCRDKAKMMGFSSSL